MMITTKVSTLSDKKKERPVSKMTHSMDDVSFPERVSITKGKKKKGQTSFTKKTMKA